MQFSLRMDIDGVFAVGDLANMGISVKGSFKLKSLPTLSKLTECKKTVLINAEPIVLKKLLGVSVATIHSILGQECGVSLLYLGDDLTGQDLIKVAREAFLLDCGAIQGHTCQVNMTTKASVTTRAVQIWRSNAQYNIDVEVGVLGCYRACLLRGLNRLGVDVDNDVLLYYSVIGCKNAEGASVIV